MATSERHLSEKFRTVHVALPEQTVQQLVGLSIVDNAIRANETAGLQEDVDAAAAEGFVPEALAKNLDARKRSGATTLGSEVQDALEWYVEDRRSSFSLPWELEAARLRVRAAQEAADSQVI